MCDTCKDKKLADKQKDFEMNNLDEKIDFISESYGGNGGNPFE